MTRKQSAHASQTTYRFLLSQPLVLVGLMGSGKTAVGSRLAEQLQMPFIDSDHEIEAQAGLSIRDIFDIGGEAKFRDLEYRVMKRLMTEQPAIIATGGGAFCQPATRQLIAEHARSLWLDASPEVLLSRIGDISTRPLLMSGDPLEILRRLAAERQDDYAQADLQLRTGHLRHQATLNKLLVLLEKNNIIAPKEDRT